MTINATEFTTESHHGILKIPAEYQAQWEGKQVKVILLESKELPVKPKKPLLKALSEIEISAPADFSENIDAYLTGEKHA